MLMMPHPHFPLTLYPSKSRPLIQYGKSNRFFKLPTI